ncbi:hypothetical protein ANN_15994, partial [Periplaneta americana]
INNQKAERLYLERNVAHSWKCCNDTELRPFFGLLVTAGQLKANYTNYDIPWSSLYGVPVFRAIMGLKRFKSLLAFTCFDDKTTRSICREKDTFALVIDAWENVNSIKKILGIYSFWNSTQKICIFISPEFQPNKRRPECSSIFGFTKYVHCFNAPKANKAVVALSAMHHTQTTSEEEKKPQIILHYNSTKGDSDTLDH